MRDEVYQVIREFDEGKRKPTHSKNGPYVNWYTDGDTEEDILVFDDWESVRDLEDAFFEIVKDEEDFRKRRDDEYDTSAIDYICEGDEHWTFSDEGAWCSECGKWYHNGEYYARFFTGDGFRMCEACVKEEPDAFIESLIDNPHNANTILDNSELAQLGFEQVNKDHWANGWYGQVDDPVKILDKAKAEDANAEYIFSVHKNYNSWETEFDLWKRKETEDDDL